MHFCVSRYQKQKVIIEQNVAYKYSKNILNKRHVVTEMVCI